MLPDGEKGELVFTSLTKEALPIIRYRTRDLTRLLPGTARTMRRMEKITGRSDDMLIIRGVNVFPTQIEELILKQPALAPHYVLEALASMDRSTILTGPGGTGDRGGGGELQHDIKSYIGVTSRRAIVAARHRRALHRQGQARDRQAAQVDRCQAPILPHERFIRQDSVGHRRRRRHRHRHLPPFRGSRLEGAGCRP